MPNNTPYNETSQKNFLIKPGIDFRDIGQSSFPRAIVDALSTENKKQRMYEDILTIFICYNLN